MPIDTLGVPADHLAKPTECGEATELFGFASRLHPAVEPIHCLGSKQGAVCFVAAPKADRDLAACDAERSPDLGVLVAKVPECQSDAIFAAGLVLRNLVALGP